MTMTEANVHMNVTQPSGDKFESQMSQTNAADVVSGKCRGYSGIDTVLL